MVKNKLPRFSGSLCSCFCFSLAYSQRSHVPTSCKSEMCCTRLPENTGRKNSPSAHHRADLTGYILATEAHIDNRKKHLKQQ